jgi:hypothetical protein
VNLFRFVPGYETGIYAPGKEPLFLLFVSFLVTFALTRMYTRLARVRGWGSASAGGVHVHHMVPGVILMAACGVFGFAPIAQNEVAYSLIALGFGAGAALTLDEFAMIFHVRDVYWEEEGRTSVDAFLMGMALSGLLLVGAEPFDLAKAKSTTRYSVFFATIALNTLVAAVSFLKRKPFLGVVATLVPAVGIVASLRLAKPASPWARWFYDAGRAPGARRARRARKLERSLDRFEHGRSGRFERWLSDVIGGRPSIGRGAG